MDDAQRERHDAAPPRPDRNLALEAQAREPPVAHERIPEHAFGLGWIAAEQPRQAAHRPPLARHPAVAVLGDERAQHLALRAVEHAAARGPLRPSAISRR